MYIFKGVSDTSIWLLVETIRKKVQPNLWPKV